MSLHTTLLETFLGSVFSYCSLFVSISLKGYTLQASNDFDSNQKWYDNLEK